MLTSNQILDALSTIDGLPETRGPRRRMIYEDIHGHFFIDYAAFLGGTHEEVPLYLIERLERDGFIVRAFPNSHCNCWILPLANHQPTPVCDQKEGSE